MRQGMSGVFALRDAGFPYAINEVKTKQNPGCVTMELFETVQPGQSDVPSPNDGGPDALHVPNAGYRREMLVVQHNHFNMCVALFKESA